MRKVVSTASGMFAFWDTAAFRDIVDYDTWESRLCDDESIEREIAAGTLVPINIGSDGIVEIEVRVGTAAAPAALSARESSVLTVSTLQPYRLATSGTAHFGGLEHVHREPVDDCGALSLAGGEYDVMVHLIDWQQEPGMLLPDSTPAPDALPDFVVLINPASGTARHRLSLETFER